MLSFTLPTVVLLSALGLVSGQTFTDCNPTQKTCPADPGLGTTITTDFRNGITNDWHTLAGTTMTYDKTNGATFTVKVSTDAPVIESNKYIMFGKVCAMAKSSPGTGIVSSFILESDDLDEIDWEWLGSADNAVQTNFFGKGDTSSYDRGGTSTVSTPIESFHNYCIDWTADRIQWQIDGATVRTLAYTDPLTIGGTRYPQTPMQVRMGNWIGCLDANNPATKGTCEWAGGQVDLTKGPFPMYVQTVTVQDYGCGGNYTYSDMSGSYTSIKSSGTCGQSTGSSSSSGSGSSSSSASSAASSSGSASATQSSSGSSSVAASSTSAKATGSAVTSAPTTLATVGAVNTAIKTGGTATTSALPVATANAGNARYGAVDMGVVALGVGLGYLVM